MGIDFNSLKLYAFGVKPNLKINNYGNTSISFGNGITKDSFQSNSPEKFFNEIEIKNMIAQNSDIQKILIANKIPLHLNMKELLELKNGHAKDTQNISVEISKNLPQALKQQVNLQILKDGALLHDFEKVLIPPEILNKKGNFTEAEHKIMDLHTELGYQLLKNSGTSEDVLSLVRNHHHNYIDAPSGRNYIPDVNLQILNVADKYSALTEERVYKNSYKPQKALTIIYGDVQRGEVHPFIFNALVKAVQNNELASCVK